jgi:hypothetical protein
MKTISVLSAIMLVLAIPSGVWPYEYYIMLRWLICGSAIWHAYLQYQKQDTNWIWIFGVMAFIFNPAVPLRFSKDIWVMIDLVSAVIFLIAIKESKR